MADCDLGEMFLNFMLDEDILPYAGVDLMAIFPNEFLDPKGEVDEHWTRMFMGFRPSPCVTT